MIEKNKSIEETLREVEKDQFKVLLCSPLQIQNLIEKNNDIWTLVSCQTVWTHLKDMYKLYGNIPLLKNLRDSLATSLNYEKDDLTSALIILDEVLTSPPTKEEIEYHLKNINNDIIIHRYKNQLHDNISIQTIDDIQNIKSITDNILNEYQSPVTTEMFNFDMFNMSEEQLIKENHIESLINDRWFAKRKTWMIYGMTGVGKSNWIILAILMWSLGKTFFGFKPTGELKCLFCGDEDDVVTIRRLLHGYVEEGIFTIDEIKKCLENVTFLNVDNSESIWSNIDISLTKSPKDYFVINPLQNFISSEKSYESVANIYYNHLQTIMRKHNVGNISIHHVPKSKPGATEEENIYGAAGSHMLIDKFRSSSVILPGNGLIRKLVNVKSRRECGFTEVLMKQSDYGVKNKIWSEVTIKDAITDARQIQNNFKNKIIKILSISDTALSIDTIAKELGNCKDRTRNKINEIMTTDSRIKTKPDGKNKLYYYEPDTADMF